MMVAGQIEVLRVQQECDDSVEIQDEKVSVELEDAWDTVAGLLPCGLSDYSVDLLQKYACLEGLRMVERQIPDERHEVQEVTLVDSFPFDVASFAEWLGFLVGYYRDLDVVVRSLENEAACALELGDANASEDGNLPEILRRVVAFVESEHVDTTGRLMLLDLLLLHLSLVHLLLLHLLLA